MANGTYEVPANASADASAAKVDPKLEVVVIPVSDVDRAKEFYAKLGWRLDRDFRFVSGQRDANWPEWIAAHLVAEQSGKALPQ